MTRAAVSRGAPSSAARRSDPVLTYFRRAELPRHEPAEGCDREYDRPPDFADPPVGTFDERVGQAAEAECGEGGAGQVHAPDAMLLARLAPADEGEHDGGGREWQVSHYLFAPVSAPAQPPKNLATQMS